jgi:hypothetical protein
MGYGYKIRNYCTIAALALAAVFAGAKAQAFDTLTVESVSYEDIDDAAKTPDVAIAPSQTVLDSFGPFHVVTLDRAELFGSIETDTPAQFTAMLRAYPALKQIDMVDCPGTDDDEANFAIAHMIRKAGIATNVPDGGSVRSGGVELFLAGAKRHAAPSAEFAVHSWRDEDGREPDDFAVNDPVNQEYIAYYREIGMSDAKAHAFYTLTNSVPNDDALYLNGRDLAAYITLD